MGLVIAISGKPGAGKTTYAKEVARLFNLRYVSSGSLFRQLAIERGVSLVELHKLAEKDFGIDRIVDGRAVEEAKRGDVVVEGHLAGWVLRDFSDLRIFFTAPLEVRAMRVAARDWCALRGGPQGAEAEGGEQQAEGEAPVRLRPRRPVHL
jgi:cytidylate kinase